MPIVTVKNKYQVVIPQRLRAQVGIHIGDVLEAQVDRGKIVFTPKALVDRAIAEGLNEVRKGRLHGPFKNADEKLAALKGKGRKPVKSVKSRAR